MMKLKIVVLVQFSLLLFLTAIHDVCGCGVNEINSKCGNGCEPDCLNADIKICQMHCGDETCVCKKGFYRSISGNCLTYEECVKSEVDIKHCQSNLGENATLSPGPDCPSQNCGHGPKKNCGNLPGCICKLGYQINKNGTCVLPENC